MHLTTKITKVNTKRTLLIQFSLCALCDVFLVPFVVHALKVIQHFLPAK